jgi:hypothetical protein
MTSRRFRLDDIMSVVIHCISSQLEMNRTSLSRIYDTFCFNDLGTLSYPDFESMLRHCCPSYKEKTYFQDICLDLLNEVGIIFLSVLLSFNLTLKVNVALLN